MKENKELTQNVYDISQRLDRVTEKISITATKNAATTERIEEVSLRIDRVVDGNARLGEANKNLTKQTVALAQTLERFQTGGDSYPFYQIEPVEMYLGDTDKVVATKKEKVKIALLVMGDYPLATKSIFLKESGNADFLNMLINSFEGKGHKLTPDQFGNIVRDMHLLDVISFPTITYEPDSYNSLGEIIIRNWKKSESVEIVIETEARNGNYVQTNTLMRVYGNNDQWVTTKHQVIRRTPGEEDQVLNVPDLSNQEE
jgi:hypothetical protein